MSINKKKAHRTCHKKKFEIHLAYPNRYFTRAI